VQYKLAIADLIGVTVAGSTITEDGAEKPFKFVLVCKRLTQEQLKAELDSQGRTANKFFEENAQNWRDQDLVLEPGNAPAAFSVDALRLLFTINGMAAACWQAYLQQVMATRKN
jgi:hypothetical protein